MNNAAYLKQKNISPETTTYRELLEVLESYGDNHWWMSDDPRTRAYYQTLDQSSPFILPYQQYINDLTVLLKREVHVYEIRMSNKAILRQDVEQAWEDGKLAEDATVHAH
ncbi:MAG TPA: hypothetical protein VHZ51_06155 [Ktedonobacteraceae bacterium]|jgi:hypothetical protein|nr:hypothetical protein [Ktedonobacteraceae bacterium]